MARIFWGVVGVLCVCGVAWAQEPPQSCEEKLANAQKRMILLQASRQTAEEQTAQVWARAEAAEKEVARLKAEASKVVTDKPAVAAKEPAKEEKKK